MVIFTHKQKKEKKGKKSKLCFTIQGHMLLKTRAAFTFSLREVRHCQQQPP
jgi:hypothetical protein